jgi:Transposase DDE domain
LAKKVFKNKDGSSGTLYLVTSDSELRYEQIFEIYKKRWKIEEYHESIKGNACLAKSLTKTVKTQTNHFFASLWAYVKLEMLKMSKSLNHQALRMKLYIKATQSAFQELQSIKSQIFA